MSDEDLKFAVVALSAIFFVIDPLANVPVFLSITGELTVQQRRSVALRAATAGKRRVETLPERRIKSPKGAGLRDLCSRLVGRT